VTAHRRSERARRLRAAIRAERRTPYRPAPDRPRTAAERLEDLRELYVERANLAVAEGREDLLPGLSDDYLTESLRLL
jgi:hypothetical protein